MDTLSWGIIGCGDVTEIKSGPAFYKTEGSSLAAVMRRNAAKAEDYARRHNVPKFYTDASQLISDPDVQAIYIATPPGSHEGYTIAALESGKPVYVEKPMSLTMAGCRRMKSASEIYRSKLTVAHYRRALPMFIRIKELLGEIGEIRLVNIRFFQPENTGLVASSEENWRVDPLVSGGGLFHDMAPHHLDLLLWFFGDPLSISGSSARQTGGCADDLVMGQLTFGGGIHCSGTWCFSVPPSEALDRCEIIGSKGKVAFAFHGNYIGLTLGSLTERMEFQHPQHIQQPMIRLVTDYFSGKTDVNPCPAEEGMKVLGIMDRFTAKY
jgi:predicted dehydrogenase